MNYEQEKLHNKRIDVTACLDAVQMYDAAFHRDRGSNDEAAVTQEQRIVSLGEYLWSAAMKSGTSLLGQSLLVLACIAGGLIFINGARNIFDVVRAQPTPHEVQNTDFVTHLTTTSITWEPSPYPLPQGYENTNLQIYEVLVIGIVVCCAGSRFSLKRARKINVGTPITHADTSHLPARASLVRASCEPVQENLVRAASLPSTPPSILLRSLGRAREVSAEQLVRPSAGRED